MNDPFKLKVLKALTAALEEITTANGYQHDLDGKVFRGRLMFTQDDKLPFVAVNEPPKAPDEIETPNGSAAAKTSHALLIQGFAQDDNLNPTDPAYYLVADVQQRLSEEKVRADGYDILGMGSRISAIHIGQPVVRPPDAAVSDTAFFWLPVTLEYAENLKNPFA
ncbi:hypothetical protein [Shimia sp.]|uniref:hypothetical protein n=1 Tax=Shimia sp. TaxID=1954381 RepID=UPI00329882F1